MPSTEITDEKLKCPSNSECTSSDIKHDSDVEYNGAVKKLSHGGKKESTDTVVEELERGKKDALESETIAVKSPDDDFPDGGLRAWLVVFGGMCNCYATFGYVNSWGIFQAYYQDTILKDYSPSTISFKHIIRIPYSKITRHRRCEHSPGPVISYTPTNLEPTVHRAWIGSIQYALVFLPGLVVGRLFDIGYFRSVFITCSIVLVVATFLIAQCTQFWHLLIVQGFLVGFACGGIFGPTQAIVAHWFKRRRGRALGFIAIGSSLGGTTIPIAAKNLIPSVGFPWTMRIIGFILLVFTGICNLTLKRRLPPVNVKGGLLNLAAFKDPPFTIYCLSSFLTFLGIYTVLTYVNVSATQLGSSPDLAFYFVAFANAASLFGRWMSGLLADKTGCMNIMIPFTFFAGILTYAWPFTHSTASLIVVTLIYGFCSGTYVSLLTAPIMNFGGEGDVGRRIGMFMTITALGAVAGPPISGAINAATGDFEGVGLYAGSTVILGVACMVTARYLVLGRWIGKL
ncbi:Riboflavin transporter MCH5 [Leucoagaricus sp. SymC.cos]|nr:Riboflavin transporter MCH5 [Leucoagaricus sp. SymC.cos]